MVWFWWDPLPRRPSCCTSRGGECDFWCLPLLLRALIPSWGSTPMTTSKANHLPKAPPPNTIALRVRASAHDFGGDTNIQSFYPSWLFNHGHTLAIFEKFKVLGWPKSSSSFFRKMERLFGKNRMNFLANPINACCITALVSKQQNILIGHLVAASSYSFTLLPLVDSLNKHLLRAHLRTRY